MKTTSLALLALLAAGCSQIQSPVTPTSTADIGGPLGQIATRFTTRTECRNPSPEGLWADPKTNGVILSWQSIGEAIDYHLILERRDVTNIYLPAGDVTEDTLSRPFTHLPGGRYRAKIQSRSCGAYGPFSDWLEFSIEGDEGPSGPSDTPPPSGGGAPCVVNPNDSPYLNRC